jgi:hypothetical protein
MYYRIHFLVIISNSELYLIVHFQLSIVNYIVLTCKPDGPRNGIYTTQQFEKNLIRPD